MDQPELDGVDDERIARARALAPRIREAADEIESLRRLPDELARAMSEAELFRLYAPRAYGGPQVDPLTALRVVEEISRADGSAGWVAMLGSGVSEFAGCMDAETAAAMLDEVGPFDTAGSARLLTTAEAVEGGYILTGRWDFQSGITHARRMVGNCLVTDGGEQRRDERGPVTRYCFIPVRDGEVIDVWHTVGMRGTGSNDFAVDGLFVPEQRTFHMLDRPGVEGPLYRTRFKGPFGCVMTAANSLGIARGALDEFGVLAASRGSTGSSTALRDRPYVQTKTAEAEAIVRSARAYLVGATREACAVAKDPAQEPAAALVDLRLAIVHAMHESVKAVDLLFHAAGTNAVYTKHRLERCFRDVHVGVQHAAAVPAHYETAGRQLLGLEADVPGW
ncbi:MAG: acyl-CoA dehydrogenase family protein [Dehalococcoidia bacterium]|jgi:alkylation response protein AidB-like acyl-CoA dehydrogenase|nr:acyl-CoA dehydrogenase family protein [Dehalococcoidia bacterium]